MGATNISAGIDSGRSVLTGSNARPNAFKTMIVMTDGYYNRGRQPWYASRDAARAGIEVHTITFGSRPDRVSMEKTANSGNGKYYHAANGAALKQIFIEIANLPPRVFVE